MNSHQYYEIGRAAAEEFYEWCTKMRDQENQPTAADAFESMIARFEEIGKRLREVPHPDNLGGAALDDLKERLHKFVSECDEYQRINSRMSKQDANNFVRLRLRGIFEVSEGELEKK